MRQVLLKNLTRPSVTPIQAGFCDSFLCRFRGLMFRSLLKEREGLLLVERTESRVNASIHMLFMRFDIAVVWLDASLCVVDVQLARRWRPSYIPTRAARYTLETRPEYLSDFQVGDQLAMTA